MASKSFTISASGFSTGLAGTIGYAIKSDTGSTLIARTTSGISETPAGSGCYVATVTGDDTWFGRIEWDASSEYAMTAFDWRSTVGASAADIAEAVWDEATSGHTTTGTTGQAIANLDAAVSTRATPADVTGASASDIAQLLSATARPTIITNITGQYFEIYRGDSYLTTDGRSLDFIIQANEPWPTDLTGYTITFTARKSSDNTNTGDATLTKTGSIVNATGDTRKVRIQLESTDTDTLAVTPRNGGDYAWDIEARKSRGSGYADLVATLRSGTMRVREDQTVPA